MKVTIKHLLMANEALTAIDSCGLRGDIAMDFSEAIILTRDKIMLYHKAAKPIVEKYTINKSPETEEEKIEAQQQTEALEMELNPLLEKEYDIPFFPLPKEALAKATISPAALRLYKELILGEIKKEVENETL